MKFYDLEKFGNELTLLRRKLNLTQDEVYKKIGTSADTLRRIENGYSIPKLETLELLSIVYKVDIHHLLAKHRLSYQFIFRNDIDSINKMIINNDYKKIDYYIKHINQILDSSKSRVTYKLMLDKLLQFRETIHIINLYDKKPDQNSSFLIEHITFALKMSISNFLIDNVHIHNYDYIEMRLLLLLSVLLRKSSQYEACKKVLLAIEENVLNLLEYSDDLHEILLKVYFNQSYLYYNLDQDTLAIQAAQKGIDYSLKIKDYSHLHLFFFRKAASQYILHQHEEAKKNFTRALNQIEINGDDKLYKQYQTIIEKKFKC